MPTSAPEVLGLLLPGRLDAAGLLVAAVLAGAYALGVRAVRRRGLSWPVSRTTAWSAGVLSLLLVTAGGIGRYAHSLLWVYALQVLVLLLLTPVLLAYGRPLALVSDASGGTRRAVGAGRVVRLLTSPLLGPLVVPVVLGVVFFSPVLRLSLTSTAAYDLLHVALLAIGAAIALGLVGDGTDRESSLALGAAVAVGLVEFLLDAVPGIVLRLRTHLVATPYWSVLHRPWGPSALVDQQHAGAVLWFVAEFGDLPLMIILVRRWIRADARETAAEDRALDERAVAEPEAAGDRPWWETDPSRLGGHRVAREQREP